MNSWLRSSSIAVLVVAGCSSGGSGFIADGGVEIGVTDTRAPETATDAVIATSAKPPTRPTTTGTGSTRWYAVRVVKLGLSGRTNSTPDANAWKQYGWDLDSRTTTRDDSRLSVNSCKRAEGSSTVVLTDGNDGRDNNYGQHFMSVVKSLKADIEDVFNSEISTGRRTLLLRLDNVAGPDNASVPGALYLAGSRSSAPAFDGTDVWPVDQSTLDSSSQPRARFPGGYMAGGVWVSGDFGTVASTVPLPLAFAWGHLDMEGVVVSFDTLTNGNGTIAGGAGISAFQTAITPGMRALGICPGSATLDQFVSIVQQTADLVLGAPNLQNTTRACDALSIALGFTVTPIAAPTSTVPATSTPDECGP